MRKALRIVSISAGIISVVSAVVLGCIYFEKIIECIRHTAVKFKRNIIPSELPE